MKPAAATHSVWAETETPTFRPLTGNTSADVCIVGAGIAGLTTAYHLQKEGFKVLVLDAGGIISGETLRTTAHLACVADDRFVNLERIHGETASRLFAESHAAAIDRIEQIAGQEKIACDFRRVDGYLFQGEKDSIEMLEEEMAAAGRAGLRPQSFLQSPPAIGFDIGPCLRFPNQAEFHPIKYLNGMIKALAASGVAFHGNTRVSEVQGGNDAFVTTSNGQKVSCKHVVVATNTPFNNRYVIHTKQAAYRTYAVGFHMQSDTMPHGLYWDTNDPYHYVRLAKHDSFDVLIVGGEDHRTGQDDDPARHFGSLETWARKHFPLAGKVEYRWSGQVMEPVDGVAFIGRNPMDDDNIYIITGDSGMGMTHGTIGGMLITDLIAGRSSPWRELYDPARKSLRSIGEFARENLNTAAQYTDWFTGSDVDSLEKIQPGSGAVVRHNLTKIAVYRDPEGDLHQCSAVCPHLGGIVAWNDVEKSWDCPCHGSRFDVNGEVICGPAIGNLEETEALELPVAVYA